MFTRLPLTRDVAVVDELARREHGRHELGAIDHRVQPAFQERDQVLRGVALTAGGLFVGARELLFRQVAVIALELLLGLQLQAEVGDFLLAALAVLAGAIGAAVHWRLRTAPDVFAHPAVDFILGAMALGHEYPVFILTRPASPSAGRRSQRRLCVTRHRSQTARAGPAARRGGVWRRRHSKSTSGRTAQVRNPTPPRSLCIASLSSRRS